MPAPAPISGCKCFPQLGCCNNRILFTTNPYNKIGILWPDMQEFAFFPPFRTRPNQVGSQGITRINGLGCSDTYMACSVDGEYRVFYKDPDTGETSEFYAATSASIAYGEFSSTYAMFGQYLLYKGELTFSGSFPDGQLLSTNNRNVTAGPKYAVASFSTGTYQGNYYLFYEGQYFETVETRLPVLDWSTWSIGSNGIQPGIYGDDFLSVMVTRQETTGAPYTYHLRIYHRGQFFAEVLTSSVSWGLAWDNKLLTYEYYQDGDGTYHYDNFIYESKFDEETQMQVVDKRPLFLSSGDISSHLNRGQPVANFRTGFITSMTSTGTITSPWEFYKDYICYRGIEGGMNSRHMFRVWYKEQLVKNVMEFATYFSNNSFNYSRFAFGNYCDVMGLIQVGNTNIYGARWTAWGWVCGFKNGVEVSAIPNFNPTPGTSGRWVVYAFPPGYSKYMLVDSVVMPGTTQVTNWYRLYYDGEAISTDIQGGNEHPPTSMDGCGLDSYYFSESGDWYNKGINMGPFPDTISSLYQSCCGETKRDLDTGDYISAATKVYQSTSTTDRYWLMDTDPPLSVDSVATIPSGSFTSTCCGSLFYIKDNDNLVIARNGELMENDELEFKTGGQVLCCGDYTRSETGRYVIELKTGWVIYDNHFGKMLFDASFNRVDGGES